MTKPTMATTAQVVVSEDEVFAEMGDEMQLLGLRIRQVSAWLDRELLAVGKHPEAIRWARVTKVAEEAGEVVDALNGATGMNPRKGVCATEDDVKDELLDVALTALGAYEHLSGARGESVYALLNHAESRLRRVGQL